MGFSRTNLFKRLESSGVAFIQSIERHILRNFIYLYALEQGLDIPIGTQEAELLDTSNNDEDADSVAAALFDTEIEEDDSDNSGDVEKLTQNLTPQPPSLLGKGENSKPLSLQERGLERGFPDEDEKAGLARLKPY